MAVSHRGRPSSILTLFIFSAVLLFSSCSSEKVLVLNDPGFDFFASNQIRFYNISREIIFRMRGYDPDFISYDPGDSYDEVVGSLLAEGQYSALVTGIAPSLRVEIPKGMKSILIEGTEIYGSRHFGHVSSSARPALEKAGDFMRARFVEDGLNPLIIIDEVESHGDDALDDVLRGWGTEDHELLTSHTLSINSGDGDIRKTLESFINSYDFKSNKYLLLAFCSRHMQDLVDLLPQSDALKLILEIPDASLFDPSPEALIVPDYKGLLRGAAELLKDGSNGEHRKIAYLFQKN